MGTSIKKDLPYWSLGDQQNLDMLKAANLRPFYASETKVLQKKISLILLINKKNMR